MIPSRSPSVVPFRIPFGVGEAGDCLPGCVVFYDLRDGGASAVDLSGSGYNGSFVGTSLVAGPVSGVVRRFALGNGIVCYPHIGKFNHTLEFWAKPAVGALFYMFDSQVGRVIPEVTVDGTPAYYDLLGGVSDFDTCSVDDDTWVHLVWVCRAGVSTTVYQFGIPHAGTLASGAVGINGQCRVGSSYDGLTGKFVGDLSIFRLYDRALSAAEVSWLYNQSAVWHGY